MQQGFPVLKGLQIDVLTEPGTQNAFAGRGGQIMFIAGTGMISVAVGYHRALDRSPRINIEITGWAIQTFGARDNKIHGMTDWMGLLVMRRGE
jgi:hypothetical protein